MQISVEPITMWQHRFARSAKRKSAEAVVDAKIGIAGRREFEGLRMVQGICINKRYWVWTWWFKTIHFTSAPLMFASGWGCTCRGFCCIRFEELLSYRWGMSREMACEGAQVALKITKSPERQQRAVAGGFRSLKAGFRYRLLSKGLVSCQPFSCISADGGLMLQHQPVCG